MMMATNLNATAKPWTPGSGGPPPGSFSAQPPQQQSQGPYSSGKPQQSYYNGRGSGSNNNSGGNGSNHSNMMSSSPGTQTQPQQQQQQTKFSPTAAKLFVGQLPFECTEERLRNLFSAYGNVEHIHILRDTSNRSRGAAFVTYSTVQEADTAIFTLHNRYRMLTNRAIQVSYAKNSPNISPFGTHSALEVHQSHPTNPVPDVAANARNVF